LTDTSTPFTVRSRVTLMMSSNPTGFHHISGQGYQFFTDQVMDMDSRNPQVAARLLGVYEIWRKLDLHRQNLIKAELKRFIASKPSKNAMEIAMKTMG